MRKFLNCLTVLFFTIGTFVSCTRYDFGGEVRYMSAQGNLAIVYSGVVHAHENNQNLIDDTKLFVFNKSDKKFDSQLLGLVKIDNEDGTMTVSAPIKVGDWSLVGVGSRDNATLEPLNIGDPLATTPMYIYAPNIVNGRSSDASELFTMAFEPSTINVNQTVAVSGVEYTRNVSQVSIAAKGIGAKFGQADEVIVSLLNVPSTISYSGDFLPSKNAPTTIAQIKAPLTFTHVPGTTNDYTANEVSFIIPAHKGDLRGDTTEHKMDIHVVLKKAGAVLFESTKQISKIALCNTKLQINLTIEDDLEINAEALPWINSNVDADINNNHVGLSVSDSDISIAGVSKDFLFTVEGGDYSSVVIDKSSMASWLIMDETDKLSGKLVLTPDVSSHTVQRTTSFTLSANNIKRTVFVTQEPAMIGVTIQSPGSVIVSPPYPSVDITLICADPWVVTNAASLSKVSLSKTSGTGLGVEVITVSRIDNDHVGNEQITFKNLSTLEEINVNAMSLYIKAPLEGTSGLIYSASGGTRELDYTVSGGIQGTADNTQYDHSWLTVAEIPSVSPPPGYVKFNVTAQPYLSTSPDPRLSVVRVEHMDDPRYYLDIPVVQKSSITVIPPAEFLTYQYGWYELDGNDMDIAGVVTNSGISDNNGNSIDNRAVGWGGDTDITLGSILTWGGDFTAGASLAPGEISGETIYINVTNLRNNHYNTIPNELIIELYSTWYIGRRRGNLYFQVDAYLGGTMQRGSGVWSKKFINVGGTLEYTSLEGVNITSIVRGATNYSQYDKIATITYNKITNTSTVQVHSLDRPPVESRSAVKVPYRTKTSKAELEKQLDEMAAKKAEYLKQILNNNK